MNRIDELTTYRAGRQLNKRAQRDLWRVCIHNKPDGCGCVGENKKICLANPQLWGLVEVVRSGLSACNGKWQDAGSLDRNDVILILQNAFHHQKLFGTEQQPVFLK